MARTRNTAAPDPSHDFLGSGQDTNPALDTNERRFAFFWGRRRLAHLVTLMPQDQREMDRLDFQHHMLRKALGRNYLVPVPAQRDAPIAILDVGCATGRWAIELAEEFPAATVVGMDLLPPEPYGGTPGNCFFQYGNVLEALPMPDSAFTFVHQRAFLDAIPHAAWPQVARELLRVTRPGGYIEVVELGLPAVVGPALGALCQWMLAIGGRHGFDLRAADRVGECFTMGDATNVSVRLVELPLGRHGGRMGQMVHTNFRAVVLALRAPIIAEGLTSDQTFDAVLAQADYEIDNGRSVLPLYIHAVRRLA